MTDVPREPSPSKSWWTGTEAKTHKAQLDDAGADEREKHGSTQRIGHCSAK